MKKLYTILVLLLLSIYSNVQADLKPITPFFSAQDEITDVFENVRVKILDHMQEKNVPSISVAVAKDGAIIWEESFGYADVEKQIKATPQTMYHLGSLGKVYTATAIMMLRERGLIDLDKPVNEYLGEIKLQAYEGDANDATVRHILNHTSGLPRFWTHLYEEELDQRPSWDEVISNYGKLVSPPGDRYLYSNLGFGILGYIIERISGKPYHQFMKEELFEPLGLYNSIIDTGPFDDENRAQKYAPEGRVPYSDHICKGGGTHFVSAHDLVLFGMFHLKNHLQDQEPVLSDESLDEMQNSSTSTVSAYTIGWSALNKFGFRIVRHGGRVLGALSSLRLIPSENIAVAVVSNGDLANTGLICDWVFAELLPQYNSFFKFSQSFKLDSKTVPEQFKPPSSLTGVWKGELITYMDSLPVQIIVKEDGEVRMKYINNEITDDEGVLFKRGTTPLFSNGIFYADFPLEIPTPFTKRYSHSVNLNLKLRDNILSGQINAGAWEPLKPHFDVPSYIRLEKVK